MERIVPVSGREELRGFNHVFWTRSTKNLVDGHLWFSVVTKPIRSRFTRVQRLTCVLTVLFTTMLTNIYNFNARTYMEADDDVVLLKLGTIKISSFSINMGIISALISVPVNIIIVMLFTKRRVRARRVKFVSDEHTTDKYKRIEIERKLKNQEEEDRKYERKLEEDDEDEDVETSISKQM